MSETEENTLACYEISDLKVICAHTYMHLGNYNEVTLELNEDRDAG